jgi:hypothetical protein
MGAKQTSRLRAATSENDPTAILAVHRGTGFGAGFSPYRSTRLKAIRCLLLRLGSDMQRREFITILGGAAVVWPVAARAQQTNKVFRIGYVAGHAADKLPKRLEAFRAGLRDLG